MRMLLLGSAGFLGRAFAAEAAGRGIRVTAVDPRAQPPAVRADLRAHLAIDATPYDLVVHAAAAVADRERMDRDPLATSENFDLDATVMRWAARTRPGRLVYLSSSAAYPVVLQASRAAPPLAEVDQPTCPGAAFLGRPDGVYGLTKLAGELLACELRSAGVPVTVVRPFSGYGTDQSTAFPFGAFCARARRRDDPFDVWGSGRQVRDFVHVSDIIGAVFTAAERGIDGPVNVCTGIGTSMDNLAWLVCDAAGHAPASFRHLDDQPGGVLRRVGDPTELLRFYVPKVRLVDGVRMALEAGTVPHA